jgi:hypothetical protein
MTPDYFIIYSYYEKLYPKHTKGYEKYDKILESLLKTDLFCVTCCITYTDNICSNSNIPKKNFSVGYTDKLDTL